MADEKIQISVEVNGAEEAQSALGKATEAQNASTEATRQNTGAVKENTSAINANTEATNSNASAQDKGTGAIKDAQNWLEKMSDKFRGQEIALRGAQHLNQAFAMMMKGQFIGAIRMASAAVTEFTMAILANPIGALVTAVIAVTAAVVGLANAWGDANKKLNEYVHNHRQVEELGNKADDIAAGGNRLADLSDEELERRRQEAKQKDEEARARVARTREQQKHYDQLAMEAKENGKIVGGWQSSSWGGRRLVRAERWNERLKGTIEEQGHTSADLKEIEAEQERRRKPELEAAKKAIEQAAAEAEAELKRSVKAAEARNKAEIERDRRQARLDQKMADLANEEKYYNIEREAESKKSGSGRLAGMQARKSDIEAEMESLTPGLLSSEEKRVELKQELFRLEQQITAELERQKEEQDKKADAEMREKAAREEANYEWARGRKLAKMEAEERVKSLDEYIKLLKEAPEGTERDKRLRSAIDERDRAQAEIDKQKEDAADKAADLYNKQQDFFHRNDTDAQKLRQNSQYLREAQERGDTTSMLELMMEGESLADNYQEPMSKWDQKKAARKAKRDQKAAQRAAKAFQRQVNKIERDWKKGDTASAAEAAANLTAQAGGTAKYEVKNGRLVKVDGQDRANQLLSEILEALK